MKLSEFLEQHTAKKTGFLGIIESHSDEPEKVIITPWSGKENSCNCESAFLLKKDLIEDVLVTKDEHICCGKRHAVVEIFFKEGASISIDDFIDILLKNSSRADHNPTPTRLSFVNPTAQSGAAQFETAENQLRFERCGSGYYNPDTQCCCSDQFGHIFVRTKQFAGQSALCCCNPGYCHI